MRRFTRFNRDASLVLYYFGLFRYVSYLSWLNALGMKLSGCVRYVYTQHVYLHAIVQYAVVTILIHVCLYFDIGSIQSFVNTLHFIVKTFSFERGKVSLWHCCAKLVRRSSVEVPFYYYYCFEFRCSHRRVKFAGIYFAHSYTSKLFQQINYGIVIEILNKGNFPNKISL